MKIESYAARKRKYQSSYTRKHEARVGEIACLWNSLHLSFFCIFQQITDFKHAESIWVAIGSDTAQRKVLLAVSQKSLNPKSHILFAIEWAILVSDQLAPYRNAYVHAFADFWGGDLDVFATRENYAEKLFKTHPEREYAKLRGDIVQATEYANGILARVHEGLPLLKRPQLRLVPGKKKTRKQLVSRHKHSKHLLLTQS